MYSLKNLKTDPHKSVEGVWVPYRGKSSLKISRSNNHELEQFKREKALEFADVFQAGGEEAEKLAEQVEVEALARFILRDWDEIDLEGDGEATPYTVEIGKEIFANPEFADFRDDVVAIADNREHYRPAAEKAATESVKKTAAD